MDEQDFLPWDYADPDGKVRDEAGAVIATVWGHPDPNARDRNAHLIAAAPQMYEALLLVHERCEESGKRLLIEDIIGPITRAIAFAEGIES